MTIETLKARRVQSLPGSLVANTIYFVDAGSNTFNLYVTNNDGTIIASALVDAGDVPAGGTLGQVLAKASGTDYDTEWVTAILADGSVSMTGDMDIGGNSVLNAVNLRKKLAADRTYYVRKDGSDSNDGMSDDSSGAFLTIGKVIDEVRAIDLGDNEVTVYVRAGTYVEDLELKKVVSGKVILIGDETTPSNVIIQNSGAAANCVTVYAPPENWEIRGFKLTGAGTGIKVDGGKIIFYNMDFAASAKQVWASDFGSVEAGSDYTISAGAQEHARASNMGLVKVVGKTVTITGTPAFSSAFVRSQNSSLIRVSGNTWSGAATGKRFDVRSNAFVDTNTGVTTHLPGDAAGTDTTVATNGYG